MPSYVFDVEEDLKNFWDSTVVVTNIGTKTTVLKAITDPWLLIHVSDIWSQVKMTMAFFGRPFNSFISELSRHVPPSFYNTNKAQLDYIMKLSAGYAEDVKRARKRKRKSEDVNVKYRYVKKHRRQEEEEELEVTPDIVTGKIWSRIKHSDLQKLCRGCVEDVETLQKISAAYDGTDAGWGSVRQDFIQYLEKVGRTCAGMSHLPYLPELQNQENYNFLLHQGCDNIVTVLKSYQQ